MDHAGTVTVYLDTQDYSRFGKVIHGAGTLEDQALFARLKELHANGLARFVYSAVVLSELLHYDPQFEHETFAKARAVEELCDGWALLWLPRLIETEVNAFGRSIGLNLPSKAPEPLRGANEWFPQIAGQLETLKETLRNGLDDVLANCELANRAQRRAAGAQKQDRKLAAALKAVVPEFADKYRLSPHSIERALVPMLRGKRTAEEARVMFFAEVAKPTSFIHAYFKVQERDSLPLNFIGTFSRAIHRSLSTFRSSAEPFIVEREHAEYLRALLRRDIGQLSAALLRMSETDEAEQGVTREVLQQILAHPEATAKIPCCQIAYQILLGYLEQTVAIHTSPSKIEASFGGDLMHLLYIDYVDIWRTDTRFAELVRQRLPNRRHKIQAKLHAIPDHIISIAEERRKLS